MFPRSPTLSPPPRPAARSSPLKIGHAISVLVVAVLLAYSGTLNAPFVYDDTLAIPENKSIRQLWPLTKVLWPQAEGGLTISGRPLLNLSFAINYAISGPNVWSYHVFNILLHTGSALLLFGLVRRTLSRNVVDAHFRTAAPAPSLALAVAAVWALHPLLTQAVTYTVQRAESLMGFFYLFTLYAFIRGAESRFPDEGCSMQTRRRWFAVSVGACALGMGTKEVMATAPLMILLYDRTFLAGTFRAAWRERRACHLALGATWLVPAVLVVSTGGNRGGTVGIGTGIALWAYPLTQFEAIARYLMLTIWPHPLVFEYGTFWVERTADLLPYALVVVPLLAGTIVALRRYPTLGFCACWFFLILAPTSLAPGTIQMIVEHRMYLPLIAVIAVIILTAHQCLGRGAFFMAAASAMALGWLTYQRNHDYRSPLALWTDTVAKRPHNPRAHDGLAEAFTALGRLNEALTHRREAVRLLPGESRYHYNLGLTLSAAGQREEAVRQYQRSLELAPHEARSHNNLAILLGEMGRNEEALAHYAEAMRLNPADALYPFNRGVALMRLGRQADAAASFETALRLRPDHSDAHFQLANAQVRLGRLEEAFSHYAEALRLKPEDSDYRITFGGALLVAKRPGDALVEYERVLATRPDAVEAMYGAANALGALRRTEEAVTRYATVLRHSRGHAGAHFKLANALLDLDRVPDAIEHYRAAVQLIPNDAEAHHNLGVAYARLEQWTEALREFEAALRLKPDYPEAQRNLQQLNALLGR